MYEGHGARDISVQWPDNLRNGTRKSYGREDIQKRPMGQYNDSFRREEMRIGPECYQCGSSGHFAQNFMVNFQKTREAGITPCAFLTAHKTSDTQQNRRHIRMS